MISSEHRWLAQIVREIASQLGASYDKHGCNTPVTASCDHVSLSAAVLMASMRLHNAADITEGNLLPRAANDNRKGV